MADENQTPDSEMIDFGFDASEADIQRPVLKGGPMTLQIASTKKEKSREKQLDMLNVVYKTTEPQETVDGKTINPGFTLIQRVLIQPTGGMTQEMIDRKIKGIHFAAAGAGRVNTGDWVGKKVRAVVKLREARHDERTGKDYPASNEIDFVGPVK